MQSLKVCASALLRTFSIVIFTPQVSSSRDAARHLCVLNDSGPDVLRKDLLAVASAHSTLASMIMRFSPFTLAFMASQSFANREAGQFGDGIDLAGPEGLVSMNIDNIKPRQIFESCPFATWQFQAYRNEVYLPSQQLGGVVAELHLSSV